jgi:hypothetical protein
MPRNIHDLRIEGLGRSQPRPQSGHRREIAPGSGLDILLTGELPGGEEANNTQPSVSFVTLVLLTYAETTASTANKLL